MLNNTFYTLIHESVVQRLESWPDKGIYELSKVCSPELLEPSGARSGVLRSLHIIIHEGSRRQELLSCSF